LHVIKCLYDGYVGGISVLDTGKIYVSFSQDKCRFHYVQQLSPHGSVQNVSPMKSLA